MGERVKALYKGFEMSLLPIAECGASPEYSRYTYSVYICQRTAAVSQDSEKRYSFSYPTAIFANEVEAVGAAYERGRQIIDGTLGNRDVRRF
ncbi:hypothetical protein [Collimonas pratensis]|uniref:hypothetical protein n=1 Tax=Collimonas pratensis TaxID=279113 RepID=UPI000783A1E8|nr:hypothetical protein [Collimonas pratensis]